MNPTSGASALMMNPRIAETIESYRQQAAAAAGLTVSRILEELYAVALGDPRSVMHVRVSCCRYCYGIDGKYQWERGEYEEAVEAALESEKGRMPALKGGLGYDAKLEPNAACRRCGGRGDVQVFVTDMRKLTPAQARMIESVEQTKDGVRVKLKDSGRYLELLMKYMGMMTERKELSGPGGGPIPLQAVSAKELSDDQLAALALGAGVVLEGET